MIPLRAALASVAGLLCASGASASTQIVAAEYAGPTTRYAHGILGDAIEHDTLRVTLADGSVLSARLDDVLVFEDTEPRLIDMDLDGAPEIVVVESHQRQGARLAIWKVTDTGLRNIAQTPFIGRAFRWLSPIGAADLDGDGAMEIAYIDRPHLAKILRVWRFSDGDLSEVATASDLTNHRIGERDIAGGIRTCGGMPEMLVAADNWSSMKAVTFDGTDLKVRTIGTQTSRPAFAKALRC